MFRLLIAGDFYIANKFHGKTFFDNYLINFFEKADYRIVNLETPLTKRNTKNRILKTGPHLHSSADTILPYLKELKVDMVTLANNHIMDYGEKGLSDTINSLKKNLIDYVGVGNNLVEASKYFTLKKDGMKIAILNFAENEWSNAEENKPGANPLNIIDNLNQIKAAKVTHDFVICIIHGGHEYYYYPSPSMVKQYRFYADNGADAIINHHTHCLGGFEVYNDVPILYSLGNFVFTIPSKHIEWYTGLLVLLKIEKGKTITFELFPVQQKKEIFATTLLSEKNKEVVLQNVEEIHKVISDKVNLLQKWDLFIRENSEEYLTLLSPTSAISQPYIRAIINRFRLGNIFQSKHYLKLLLNLIRCEAHYNAILDILKLKINK